MSTAGDRLLADWAYWESKGYSYEQAGLLAYQESTGKHDLRNRLDQVRWFLEQAGMSTIPGVKLSTTPPVGSNCPLENATKTEGGWVYRCKDVGNGVLRWGQSYRVTDPTPAPTPVPTPAPTPITPTPITPTYDAYVMDIKAPVNPVLPGYIVDKLRFVLDKGGWELVSIENSTDGYHLNLNKYGSIALTLTGVIVLSILALIGIGVISWTIVRVSDNIRTTKAAGSVAESTKAITDYAIAAGLTPEEVTELLNGVRSTYEVAVTPPPEEDKNGIMKGLGGIFENLPLLIGGIMVITLIGALKK